MSNDEKLFRSLGLKDSTLQNINTNQNTANALKECIQEAAINNGCDPSVGKLIFDIATSKKMSDNNAKDNRRTLLQYVVKGGIQNVVQLAAAYKYCTQTPSASFNTKEFEKMCGVGVVVTEEQLNTVIDELIEKHKNAIKQKGNASKHQMYKEIRTTLPWCDGKLMSTIFNAKFAKAVSTSGFVPKKKKPKPPKPIAKPEPKEPEEEVETIDKWLKGRALDIAENTESQLKQKEDALKALNLAPNTFLSRFPPEPNGFLHIGHCKAMTFNFRLASSQDGYCYLRFDDTNPTTEKQLYIDNIIENVQWMGFNAWKITYSSSYFQELYELAIILIKKGYAYVCHQSGDQIEAERRTFRTKDPKPSPYRNRSVSENLRLFELMRIGYFAEGEAVLRMKGDYTSPNPNMWDHVAYRIMYYKHPKSGDKWCIYPTYDYTHCTVDSLEYITASCCTLEFENRRESYFWLLDKLDIYKPIVWEYSRLNLQYNVLSKRKLLVLVNAGYVRGWNDARMLTINGLRRKGFTSSILREFCNRVGVTRKDNYISPVLLDACARMELNTICSRAMAVIKPLKIVLTNYDENKWEDIECPDHPENKENGALHRVKFSKIIYIDMDDFKSGQISNKKYFGLTEGKTVRLKYAYNIKCNGVIYDSKGNIDHLECEYDADHEHNVKRGHLTWCSQPIRAQFRLYDNLFSVEKPGGDNWLKQLNPNSEQIYEGFIDKYVADTVDEKKRFQFERFGYFVKDDDSEKEGILIFNRTVTLTETAAKRTRFNKQQKKQQKGAKKNKKLQK